MSKYILFFFLLISTLLVKSQQVYYGYPKINSELRKGDIVILNIPVSYNCRFNSLEEFDNLINLIKVNENNKLRIEINYFYGDSLLSENCSRLLHKHFIEALESQTTLKNYQVINNGCRNPIFKSDNHIYYSLFNSRIEISVE